MFCWRTLVLALHVWLDSYPEDFRAPPTHPTLHQLLYFCHQHLPESELEVKVRHRLDRFSKEDQMLGEQQVLKTVCVSGEFSRQFR
jgi:ral guanine nucleotide dissociation stimulator-like 1